jgi:hypothetical protein
MYSLDSILESPLLEKIHLHAARIVEIVSHCMKEELEDTKWIIRIRKSKKDRQRNGQKDIQRSTKHTHKAKDRVTRTPLKIEGELRSLEIVSHCMEYTMYTKNYIYL